MASVRETFPNCTWVRSRAVSGFHAPRWSLDDSASGPRSNIALPTVSPTYLDAVVDWPYGQSNEVTARQPQEHRRRESTAEPQTRASVFAHLEPRRRSLPGALRVTERVPSGGQLARLLDVFHLEGKVRWTVVITIGLLHVDVPAPGPASVDYRRRCQRLARLLVAATVVVHGSVD